jgi:hypothetical protein
MPAGEIIATKEDVEAFRDSWILLRAQWEHFGVVR